MKHQIDKMQMLYDIEKSLLSLEVAKQKKSAVFIAATIVLLGLALLTANVAVYLHFSELHFFAQKAWIMVAINIVLSFIPLYLIRSAEQKSPAVEAAESIRDSLFNDLKSGVESSVTDLTESVEKMHRFGKDIKQFSEGGLTALIPIIKLASETVGKKKDGG